MSASLVGSEMCIRDRPRPVGAACRVRFPGGFAEHAELAILQRRHARCARAPLPVARTSPLHAAFAARAGSRRGRGRGWV
eukprot:6063618-Alexandrium_andersonii.AAC.1